MRTIIAPPRSLVLDVDSTLAGIEGIDWLAARRGEAVSRRISELTARAMQGGLPLEQVYGARLAEIRPTRDEIEALSRAYVDAVAPGAVETIARLRGAGVHVVLISGGIRRALLGLASLLGIGLGDVHAVSVRFDAIGDYAGYDTASPLTTSEGKRIVVAGLGLEGPIVAVGDGATDVAVRDVVDVFVAYTGFARRESVVSAADAVASSFAELERLVLP